MFPAISDSLSRTQPVNTEWELSQTEFRNLCQHGIQQEIDLFASPINHKLPLFMCPFPHPRAYSTDAFTANWNKWETIYLFPPINLLPRVTSNLMTFLGTALITLPLRPTAPWFPALIPRSSIHNLLEPPFQIVKGELISTLSIFSEPWVALIFSGQSFEGTTHSPQLIY